MLQWRYRSMSKATVADAEALSGPRDGSGVEMTVERLEDLKSFLKEQKMEQGGHLMWVALECRDSALEEWQEVSRLYVWPRVQEPPWPLDPEG